MEIRQLYTQKHKKPAVNYPLDLALTSAFGPLVSLTVFNIKKNLLSIIHSIWH